MNDRQREIIEAATENLLADIRDEFAASCSLREVISRALYQLAIDFSRPPPKGVPEVLRRAAVAGEVLPPHQRASWARERTVHDG